MCNINLVLLDHLFTYCLLFVTDAQPYYGLIRMHYHTWKDNAAGVKRSFKVEGEFHQQVEIDIHNESYVKLNVPSIMKAQRSEILHDFDVVCTLYCIVSEH